MIATGQEKEGEDQGIILTSQLIRDSSRRIALMNPADQESNPILIGAEAKCGLALAMAVLDKGNAAPWSANRVADWLDSLCSQTVTLKCDNEPAILAPPQEIRRLRKAASPSSSILSRGEAEQPSCSGQNEHREGSHQNLEEEHEVEFEDRDWPVSSADTMDH